MFFVTLKDWKERRDASQHVDAVVKRINKAFADRKNLMVFALNSPPLPDLGSTSGFDFRLQDRGGLGYEALTQARQKLLAKACLLYTSHRRRADADGAGRPGDVRRGGRRDRPGPRGDRQPDHQFPAQEPGRRDPRRRPAARCV